MRHITIWSLLLLLCFVVAGCGGGGKAQARSEVSGQVIEGYVEGARVYVVPVGDLTPTQAKYKAKKTDSAGNFKMKVPDRIATDPSYYLISIGGTDTATGESIPDNMVFTGPMDAKVLSPLTTLVTRYAMSSGSPGEVTDAATKVAEATGITLEAAKDTILYNDYISNAAGNVNSRAAYAANMALAQLTRQQVLGSGLEATIDKIVSVLQASGPTPVTMAAAAVAAAGSDPVAQAKAAIIVEAIQQAVAEVVNAAAAAGAAPNAELLAQLQTAITAAIQTKVAPINSTTVTGLNISDVVATVKSDVVANTLAAVTGLRNSATSLDLTTAANRTYFLDKVSTNSIPALLGAKFSSVTGTAAALAVPAGARKAAVNPCADTPAGQSVTVPCADILGSSFCTASGNGTITVTVGCVSGGGISIPGDITLAMNSFTIPSLDTTLSGTITLTDSTMSFQNVTTGGASFNGGIRYTMTNAANPELTFAVTDAFTITSSGTSWTNMTLDSFTHGTIVPGDNAGRNAMSVYISGKGTSGTKAVDVRLNVDRVQDAMIGTDLQDAVDITLNGTVVEGREVTQFSNLKVTENRYFASQGDSAYQYKLDSILNGSKVATNQGYAFFNATGLRFDYNGTYSGGGTLNLTNTLPQPQ